MRFWAKLKNAIKLNRQTFTELSQQELSETLRFVL